MKRLLVLLILIPFLASAQDAKNVRIKKAQGKITLDGILNEADWKSADVAEKFEQTFPFDSSQAETRTDVMLTYDDKNLYIAAICFDEIDGKYVIQSLKRDFSFPVSDAFAVFIDPFDDGANGFSFSVNPLGVQREGTVENGGGFGVTTAWDNRWFSEVKVEDGKWIVEMKIPFKSIRYNSDISEWGINFARNDLKRNESSTWSWVQRGQNVANLAYTGKLLWDAPPKKAGANVSIIPYGIVGVNHDYEVEKKTEVPWNLGLDAKIAVTSSLNLDLTIRPDFSQVEVDRQVTNLSRFSLFFPEQRQFFIENNDLFARFGFSKIRPFFSRRIGLNGGQIVPILGGFRLSGKVNKNWRIGFMSMQTEGGVPQGSNSENFTVAAVQRRVFKRSNIGMIFVNKQAFDNFRPEWSDYNRLLGLDFNLASANGKWQGKAFYHHSFSPGDDAFVGANATWLMYNSANVTVHWNHEYVNKGYNAEVGFVPRLSRFNSETGEVEKHTYWRLEPSFSYKFFPKNGKVVNWHGPKVSYDGFFDEQFSETDRYLYAGYKVKFKNTSYLEVGYEEWFTKLFFDTDVTFTDQEAIGKGGYDYRDGFIFYKTDVRKRFTTSVRGTFGSYYSGTKFTSNVTLGYRAQPFAILSVAYNQNQIWLPNGRRASLHLIGPKFEFSFTRSIFFTTFFQYNTQADNFNINARFQWRFKPMSDLYLVYTDNYDQTLSVKNRAVVLKLIWWITL
ncbi:MAG: hypothetical protein ACI8P5_002277 [Bacteroidia bacterium]|jgi:hypothetical protein